MPHLLVGALCLALAAFAPAQTLPPAPLTDADTVVIDAGAKNDERALPPPWLRLAAKH
jgi:hypothetical protein